MRTKTKPNLKDLRIIQERVERRVKRVWSVNGFSGSPPEVSRGLVQVVIEEYEEHMGDPT